MDTHLTYSETLSREPRKWLMTMAIVLICLFLLAWSASAMQSNSTGGSGLSVAKGIVSGILHPTPSLLLTLGDDGVPYLLFETMAIAFLGTLVGAVLSLPFAFLGASNIVPKPVSIIIRLAVMLMFIMVTGPGAFAGLLTMSTCSIGMLSKMFIESIEELDRGIIESLDAAGCNTFDKIRYGILPQLMPSFSSTLIYRFDMNLRDASVLGLVGAGGIGAPLMFAMNSYRWNDVGAILLGLIILVLLVEWVSSKLRTKLMRG